MKPDQGFILVVDDNEANRDVLSRRLQRQGHTVISIDNGREALSLVRQHAFDLILLDIMMPDINGYQVLETLKADPVLRYIPVIMISALDDIESVVRCIGLGAEDYLAKPFNPILLKARVNACLEKKRLRDQERAYLETIKQEMELGQRIQLDFLPESLIQPDNWLIDVFFEPASEVAGDFYDVFWLPNNHIGLIIADVCDKGVGAALFMALVRSLIRAFAEQVAVSPVDALDAIPMTNNYIARHHHNHRSRTHMFATLFFGVLNPNTGELTYINAGHEPPVLIGERGIKGFLETTGPAVGLMAESVFTVGQTTIDPGVSVFAYTDGVTEMRDPQNHFFGEDQLFSILNVPSMNPSEVLLQVQQKLHDHMGSNKPLSDDITMLAFQRQKSFPSLLE